jgi:1,4-alpha-glucan branching enzyme
MTDYRLHRFAHVHLVFQGRRRGKEGIMVTVERDGSLTFRVYLPNAQSVELVADFTDWASKRVPLQREADARGEQGWWRTQCRCPSGEHSFSYLVDDHWWFPDYAAHGVRRNQYGNWTSLLVVPPPAHRPKHSHAAKVDREHSVQHFEPKQSLIRICIPDRWDAVCELSHFTAAAAQPCAG